MSCLTVFRSVMSSLPTTTRMAYAEHTQRTTATGRQRIKSSDFFAILNRDNPGRFSAGENTMVTNYSKLWPKKVNFMCCVVC